MFASRATQWMRTTHPLRKFVIATVALAIGGAEHEFLIDGVTAASDTGPRPPELTLTATPPLSRGVIRVTEGQTVTINLRMYDSQDPTGQYNDDLVPKVLPADTPPGAKFQWSPNGATARYTWTPAVGDAATYPEVALTFTATNSFLGGTSQEKVTLSFATVTAPEFTASVPDTVTGIAKQRTLLPIQASATTKTKIIGRKLPKGARLGATRKNAATGLWTAQLRWKPKANQVGKTYTSTFIAKSKVNGQVLQSNHTIVFTATAP